MRGILILSLAAMLLPVALPARGEQVLVINDFEQVPVQRWNRRFGGYWVADPRVAIREQITQAFNLPRAQNTDDWQWRDTVEDALVAIGPGAAGYLPAEMERRAGYAADAAQAALFRLDHGGVTLRPMLRAWAEKRFPGSATDGIRSYRVMGRRAALPHHLFYIVEATDRESKAKHRVVVALAADGKVQDVTEDASLARFLQVELPAPKTDAAREHAAELVALLAAARHVTSYKTECDTRADGRSAHADLKAESARVAVDLTFGDGGQLLAVATSAAGTGAAPLSAPVVPSPTTPPPAMPE